MDGTQPTQATQNVLDPRRIGKQNSGFSDEDISDIICVLYPQSEAARQEIYRLAKEGSPHVIGKHLADGVEPDYNVEDHASRFESHPIAHGNYAIILRLSSPLKNPAAGFTFGRNTTRCDVVFQNDPLRRLSNIHFRVHVNEYGNVMIEDQSTNGTFVDRQLLTCHPKGNRTQPPTNKWVLSSGTLIKILLHDELRDLTFRVRVPRRDEGYDRAFLAKVAEFYNRYRLPPTRDDTAHPHPLPPAKTGGILDIFKVPGAPLNKKSGYGVADPANCAPQAQVRQEPVLGGFGLDWKGSRKYNRIAMIGKGAFAVVYKVTSSFTGVPYAAKEIEKRRFIKNGILDQKVDNEMKIMQRVQHPNIVRYIENFDWEDRLHIIIMEYIPGGDLGRAVTTQSLFTVDMTRTMAAQLLSALGYLHANKITHRDVKPDNILIVSREPLVVKLTDFGLSKMIDSAETFLQTFCGTLLYCAPEVYTEYAEYDERGRRIRGKKVRRMPGQRYNHAVDIWSLGGVLFFSLTALPPFPVVSGISYSEILHKIMTTDLDVRPLQRYGVDEAGVHFVRRMLDRRPESRAQIPELEGHVWLGGGGCPAVLASQSYDVITDDEENPSQVVQSPPRCDDDDELDVVDEVDEDVICDSMSGASSSDKENEPMGEDSELERQQQPQGQLLQELEQRHDQKQHYQQLQQEQAQQQEKALQQEKGQQQKQQQQQQQPRPHSSGEVGASAMGSSGIPPSDFANRSSQYSLAATEIRDFVKEVVPDSDAMKGQNQRAYQHNSAATDQEQSTDQLQTLIEIVASQSLGGAGSPGLSAQDPENQSASRRQSHSVDPTSSKRKPSSNETSEDADGSTPPLEKPTMKRLKSGSKFVQGPSEETLEEYKLLARVPPMNKAVVGRRYDMAVNKIEFWEQQRETWHLHYPEMTRRQYDAFRHGAMNGQEVFLAGKSPLWDLAMKYFPPIHRPFPPPDDKKEDFPAANSSSGPSLKREDSRLTKEALMKMAMEETPSTTAPIHSYTLPNTLPSDTKTTASAQQDPPAIRAVALIETEPSSSVQGIAFPVTDVFLSFGRGPDNTEIFKERLEPRVPKYAFKLLLWKKGYEPYTGACKNGQPWLKDYFNNEASSFHFWISTKATGGIRINNHNLPSSDPKNPDSPSRYWTRVYDGDSITVWGGPPDLEDHTTLTFRCLWGGSSLGRPPAEEARIEYASAQEAADLDVGCQKTVQRLRDHDEMARWAVEAQAELVERNANIERERERSRVFEGRRVEAVRYFAVLEEREEEERRARRRGLW
ncbi:hypothetical protein E4U50_002403 [Claviceps purpurea]|nr:hypothetical protein E4U50_002403 [Claviceps purpurea]